MRYTPSGQPVTSFSVATTRVFNRSEGTKAEETTWFRVTTWGKQAETCNQYLKKGSKVGVTGRLTPGEGGSPRIWTKTDGTPAASFEVNASEVHFLGGGNGANGASAEEASAEQGEEIPF
jgi:single-strand DNA-binding protein